MVILTCRPKPCTASDIYEFIWRTFVLAKGNFPDIGDDLVNCYHLLLCVIDWAYINCVLGKRVDLIKLTVACKAILLPSLRLLYFLLPELFLLPAFRGWSKIDRQLPHLSSSYFPNGFATWFCLIQ